MKMERHFSRILLQYSLDEAGPADDDLSKKSLAIYRCLIENRSFSSWKTSTTKKPP